MRFQILGSVEVKTDDGRPVALAGDRQRRLLATLLARRGHLVSADALIEALWWDGLPDHPGPALQSQVHRLRRVLLTADNGSAESSVTGQLETSQLEARHRGYVLDVPGDQLDADRFERLAAAAGTAAPHEAADLLDEALALWQGPAYDGLAEGDAEGAGDAVRLEAIRLDEARTTAFESWGEAALATGRAADVAARLDAVVRQHPLRERARSTLMRALYLQGQQAAALETYGEYRQRIADELGLEPSAAMQRLEVAILRHEVSGTGDPAVMPSVPSPRQPFGPGLDRMRISYLQVADGHRVAVGRVGSGVPVVASPGWVSSLAVIGSGRDPRSSLFQRMLSSTALTLYDRRGTGLSPGPVADFGFDAAVAELEGVLDQMEAPTRLLAMSQAGPVAVAVAARRPDLVRRLVLWGSYADGPGTFRRPDLNASLVALVRAHWGLGSRTLADLYQPGVSAEAAQHFAMVLRDSAPADVAASYLEQVFELDVSPLLASVRAPALVLHCRGDRVIPFVGGQQLAAGLPDCSFLALEGRCHLPQAGDLDRVTEAIVDFLA
ncbi:MAG: hypothetical protein QOC80_1850 [Frankiaceae bacterium]|nr:hypothetical protein [Frankiaceae bacterium]